MERAVTHRDAGRDRDVASPEDVGLPSDFRAWRAESADMFARGWFGAYMAQVSSTFLAIRFKVFALMTVVGTTLVLMSGFFVFHLYSAQVESLIRARAIGLGEVLGNSVKRARGPADLQFIVDAISNTPRIGLVTIIDADNNVVASSQSAWRGVPVAALPDQALRDEFMRKPESGKRLDRADTDAADFMVLVTLPTGDVGKLFFRLNVSAAMTGLQQTAWSILVWLAASAVVAVLMLSLLIQRVLIAPIETLRAYAERRGAAKFVPSRGPRDEIAIVAAALTEAFEATSENETRLADLARTDSLTGLGNRSHFKSRLAHVLGQAEVDGGTVGVVILNLDKFKDINDTLGHDSGDVILQRTAEILKNCQRKGDAAEVALVKLV